MMASAVFSLMAGGLLAADRGRVLVAVAVLVAVGVPDGGIGGGFFVAGSTLFFPAMEEIIYLVEQVAGGYIILLKL